MTAVVLAAMIARLGRTGGVKQPALAVTAQANQAAEVDVERYREPPESPGSPAAVERRNAVERFGMTGRLASKLAWLGSVLLAAVLIAHGIRDAWIEDRLAGVGLPPPGTLMATVGTMEAIDLGPGRMARRFARCGSPSS